jgi:hypothetical protein
MKKKILSQLMILSFAFAGLFLVANNLMADNTGEHDEGDIPPAITCHQYSETGRCNVCWINTTFFCSFSGYQEDRCCI